MLETFSMLMLCLLLVSSAYVIVSNKLAPKRRQAKVKRLIAVEQARFEKAMKKYSTTK